MMRQAAKNADSDLSVGNPVAIRLYILWGTVALLVFIGMLNLYSATNGGDLFYNQLNRTILAGLMALFLFRFVSPRFYLEYSWWIYGLTVVLLLIVMVVGDTAGGAQRWIAIGSFRIQPSEFAKITAAILTAKFFSDYKYVRIFQLRDLLPIIFFQGIIFLLIFLQPDLGTGGVCLLIAFSQLFFLPLRTKSLVYGGGVGFVVCVVGWLFFLRDYQKLRVLNLLNPNLDPSGSGYNSIQSLVAIGSGGLFGKGFFQGTQTRLQFLPARHTDFIFSVFAEEWGLLGCLFVSFLFIVFLFVIIEIARHATDLFQSLLVVGIGAMFFLEMLINIAMVLGMFPVVGMPLPFFSYGGSAMLMMLMCVGIVASVERHTLKSKVVGDLSQEVFWSLWSTSRFSARRRSLWAYISKKVF